MGQANLSLIIADTQVALDKVLKETPELSGVAVLTGAELSDKLDNSALSKSFWYWWEHNETPMVICLIADPENVNRFKALRANRDTIINRTIWGHLLPDNLKFVAQDIYLAKADETIRVKWSDKK